MSVPDIPYNEGKNEYNAQHPAEEAKEAFAPADIENGAAEQAAELSWTKAEEARVLRKVDIAIVSGRSERVYPRNDHRPTDRLDLSLHLFDWIGLDWIASNRSPG